MISPSGRLRTSLLLTGCFSILTAFCAPPAFAQEDRLVQLGIAHDQAVANYEAAELAARGREVDYEEASRIFVEAQNAGDEEALNQAFVEVQRALNLRVQADRELEQRAEELREARRNLLEAKRIYTRDLLARAELETDPVELRAISVYLDNNNQEIARIRLLPEPEITLEPLPGLEFETTDGPVELRQKAGVLDFQANRYQEQLDYFQQQLDDLRSEQDLFRRSSDFRADRSRFGDRPPVGAQAGQNAPRPEQLDQQIRELEAFQEELTRRIEIIKTRAADFRRRAGGGVFAQ